MNTDVGTGQGMAMVFLRELMRGWRNFFGFWVYARKDFFYYEIIGSIWGDYGFMFWRNLGHIPTVREKL